jgi:hypothetical protein
VEILSVCTLRRFDEAIGAVASGSISASGGVADYLIEEPPSRLVNVEFLGLN